MHIDRLNLRITSARLMAIQTKLKGRFRLRLRSRWRNRWSWNRLLKTTIRGFSNKFKLSRKSYTLSPLSSERRLDLRNNLSSTPLASKTYLTAMTTRVSLTSVPLPIELTSLECQDLGLIILVFSTRLHPPTVFPNSPLSTQTSWKNVL